MRLHFFAILLLTFIFIVPPASAGNYIEKYNDENITISYKWRRKHFFIKNSPLILVLKIRNDNPHKVKVNFSVDYFWKTVIHSSSDTNTWCIKAGDKVKGKIRGLAFTTGSLTKQQIYDESFTWDISGFRVEHNSDCKTELIFRIRTVEDNGREE